MRKMAEFQLRPAAKGDAPAIAKLFLISSDGLAGYIWSKMAGPDESMEAVGARRYARENTAFSFENCTILEGSRKIAGMLHGFKMEEDPDAADANTAPEADPVLRPYRELEDYGSFYVSGVTVEEEFRGQGLGTWLMQTAEARAKDLRLPRVSLICFERNESAYRFYERFGYRELMRRALVPSHFLHYKAGDAVLLAKEI